jgi:peptidylprolyl isomerase
MCRHITALFVLLAMTAPAPALAEALEGKKSSAEILSEAPADHWRTLDQENLLYIRVATGTAIVALSESLAQRHVEQVKKLARQGFYDDLSFYRVIDGFVAQGGDPFEERDIGDAAKTLTAEFEQPHANSRDDAVRYALSPFDDGYADGVGFVHGLPIGLDQDTQTIWHLHCTGAFAFGRENDRHTASTEFYITLQPQRYLDRNLTVVGRVVVGMEHIQRLRRNTPPEEKGDDIGDRIISMRIGSDLPRGEQKRLQILKSKSASFKAFLTARANRPEAFFYYRPNYIDICQLPTPVREEPARNAE